MSVLIKGMKMPQSCFMCDMQELSGVVGCKHAYDTSNSEWGRALNCPLIEIPDHGDLIDRDAFRKKWKFSESCNRCERDASRCQYLVHETDGYEEMSPVDVCWMLSKAPVVIPAERSEE